MSDFSSLYQQGLYLSPDQQDLLLAALSSNNQSKNSSQKPQNGTPHMKTESEGTPGQASAGSLSVSPSGFDRSQNQSGGYGYGDDDSPFLDFNPEVDFDFPGSDSLIGDLPGGEYEPGDKRKDIDGDENEESGKKRRESDDKAAKKPGRKPLTSEPTSKRKAQNRAAQRAFRERKEKHLKDLETKVDELQKNSDDANQENGLLRAQVERLQVELREYRKRLSWVTSGNGVSAMNAIPGAYSQGMYGLKNNDFLFDFPKFGDLPGSQIFNNSQLGKTNQDKLKNNQNSDSQVPGVLSRDNFNSSNGSHNSPASRGNVTARSASGTPTGNGQNTNQRNAYASSENQTYNSKKSSSTNDTSNSDSPSSSSDSHHSQFLSSSGTSPEPSLNSPAAGKPNEAGEPHSCTIDGEKNFCAQLGLACGNIRNPIPVVRHNSESASNTPVRVDQPLDTSAGLDSLAQENGGQFDPVLFGDWREPQDAVLSQDFGTFFDDAFPLPDLGSPGHNISEAASQSAPQPAPKKDLISQIDNKLDEEVVPGEDKSQMLSCTKIWDRLQSMERFRNGEIDVDHLCSELRTKARCSEGGVVVNQTDVDDIMGRAK
ncbi:hypothetical protein ASPWEDRAFT_32453 [Aspergillus wentii DTO 134E9]|uniref:BZIP domain-containing protein n=1 Tax=Aspergillus wentii DTO 134E9 TaxID=1073089 RepID=A0A1L9R5R1_ASPWE|nr:uncharacterized protein ASPWEDRAFT_32453 [Aspergillus wentii DTO 134E9]KAI9925250.1 DNA-binding transcription factor yap1 [Aspergillus wentii]OJJ30255.1 hypothetical protein ASPWEDRAFT_32453 [Aspergillus wentii DTO 134E9]